MANIFDFFDPTRLHTVPRFEGDVADALNRQMKHVEGEVNASSSMQQTLTTAVSSHTQRIREVHTARTQQGIQHAQTLLEKLSTTQTQGQWWQAWAECVHDGHDQAP